MTTAPQPLGLFATVAFEENADLLRPAIRDLSGRIPKADRPRIASYLRGATMIHAWMGVSRDILDGHFETPGGDAVMTDGSWFWRYDTADYIENYGVGLHGDFIAHLKRTNGIPPALAEKEAIELDRILMDFYRSTTNTEIIKRATSR